MTPTETITVLAYLTAAYPQATLDEHTPDVWIERLGDVDPEAGIEAAHRIVDADEWFPTVARFREVVRIAGRAAPALALPLPRPTPEEAAAGIAAARAELLRGQP